MRHIMAMPTCFALRHLAFEDLGAFAPVLAARGFTIRYGEAGIDPLPDPLGDDLAIILGGPIGVYETEKYPWVIEEIAWLKARMAAKNPTLGVCLGAQLIASAAGARVYPGAGKEIGFAPLTLTPAGLASALAPFAQEPDTLHWHGDTFDLPPGATLLASTALFPHQAFAIGPDVLATQFHPEAGGPGFERWLIGHTLELAQAGVDVPNLRADAARLGPALAAKAERVLASFLAGAGLG